MAILSFKKSDHIMILSTALIGSYGIIRGLSFYFGGYPNEFEVADMIQSGDTDDIPYNTFFIYLGLMVISFGVGCWF